MIDPRKRPSEIDEILDAVAMRPRQVLTVDVNVDDLSEAIQTLRGLPDATFADLFGVDQRSRSGGFQLHIVWSLDLAASWLDLVVALEGDQPEYPSLTPILPAAGWYERELRDELGIIPRGHPALGRLRRPASWPTETPLLRSEFSWLTAIPEAEGGEDEELPALVSAPEGVIDYPLGPVQSGVIESSHFTLRTIGEEIVDTRIQLFYKFRGAEKRAEGLSPRHATLITERITGTGSFANSLAFCQAVESAAAAPVPDRARYLRTLFAELERLYNHLGYQADLCQATGLGVAQAQFEILKERQLRLNAALSGHRYLFGLNIPGGLTRDLDLGALDQLRWAIDDLTKDLDRLEPMLLGSTSHLDRLEQTGILSHRDALDFGAQGPVGRASGIDRDLRRDHPYAAYESVSLAIPKEEGGDALARFRVRLGEARASIHIIKQILGQLPTGPVMVGPAQLPAGASGLGWAESSRGETLYWIQGGGDGIISRLRARPASFANWQAFPLAVPGHNILTDFPIILESFGLSVAGADR